jgi:hypothetical protein
VNAALRSAAFLSVIWWVPGSLAAQPRPNPGLHPGEVIRTVIESLQNCNSPAPNAGIFTVYQFASPANRANTGPYGTFLRMVRLPGYAPLFSGHADSYSPLNIAGDRAEQAVGFHLDGSRVAWFRFVLSRQTNEQTRGHCAGCWMVDAVNPIRPQP